MFSEWLEDLKSFYDRVLTPELLAAIKGYKLRNPDVGLTEISRKLGIKRATIKVILDGNSCQDIKPSLSYHLLLDI